MSDHSGYASARSPKATIVAMLLLLAGGTSAFGQPTSVLAKRGEDLVSRECAMCHALGQSGGSPVQQAPSFQQIARRSDLAVLKQSFERKTLSGHPPMPRFTFAPSDIEAIIAYLGTLKEP